MSVPSHGGQQPSCEVAPHRAWVVHAILDSFFQVSESDLGIPWRRIGFFHPVNWYYFILFHFNIPCMVTVVFLQVVALLDI